MPFQKVTSSSGPKTKAVDKTKNEDEARRIKEMIDWAISQRGKDYVFGSNGGNTFDCSKLVQSAAAKVGVNLPRNSQDQLRYCADKGLTIDVDKALHTPGALLFRSDPDGGGHVAISLGDGKHTIEARGKAYNQSNGGPGGVSIFDNADNRNWTAAAMVPGLKDGYGDVPTIKLDNLPIAHGSMGGGGGDNDVSGNAGASSPFDRYSQEKQEYDPGFTSDQYIDLISTMLGQTPADFAALLGISLEALKQMKPAEIAKAVKAVEGKQLQNAQGQPTQIPVGTADKAAAAAATGVTASPSAAPAGDSYAAPAASSGGAPMAMPTSFADTAAPASPAPVSGVPMVSASALSSSAGIHPTV